MLIHGRNLSGIGTMSIWSLLWIIALASIHGVIEQHLVELEYFPFLFAAFADMSRSKKKRHGKKK